MVDVCLDYRAHTSLPSRTNTDHYQGKNALSMKIPSNADVSHLQGIYPGRTTVQQQLLTVPAYIVGACFVLAVSHRGRPSRESLADAQITFQVPYAAMKLRRRGVFLIGATPLVAAG
jgi:hypothetical protein